MLRRTETDLEKYACFIMFRLLNLIDDSWPFLSFPLVENICERTYLV